MQNTSVGWLNRVFILVIIGAFLSACSSVRQPAYATPGALYVEFWGTLAPNNAPQDTVEIRNGKVVAQYPVGYIVARDRPTLSGSAPNSAKCIRAYRLSPDGAHGLRYSESDGKLRLFDPATQRLGNVVVENIEDNANAFAWLDNHRIVATVLDEACPYATLYEYFPTRVETFDLDGHHLARGPCAFGVVAGQHRLAIMGEAPNSLIWHVKQLFVDDAKYYNDGHDRVHHTWSVDGGKTWHDGMPLAFDGNDLLLYREPFGEKILSENGAVALKNAYAVQWSR